MPLRLDIKRKLTCRSDRVKSVDLHDTEPWALIALYNGNAHIWNTETLQHVKQFEVCELPVRCARFVSRKNWVVTGSDDMQIRVFNYNTLEKIYMFEAHSDYIRCIAVHPTQPYILTSSDDMFIKLWDWDKKWSCSQIFEGHTHYVMQIVINPKDNNQFASASLDRTIKVWSLGSPMANFTLEGHEKGVNCVDFYMGGDKPYLISGADDKLVKIWDYQTKACVQTLEGHAQNVVAVCFHPELPICLSGSEDGTVRVWHANTYRLETTLNYGLERCWCIQARKGSNEVALGYDDGAAFITLGRDEPAMSMDSNGKIIFARHSEVSQSNLKQIALEEQKDGERLPIGQKDMGSCEIYPQQLSHNPNGRFVAMSGDGEYIIYTSMALRNKAFGSALEFVWAEDSSEYAIRESGTVVKLFKNFKERNTLKPDFGSEQIFGGHLLGVKTSAGLAFYDWQTLELVRRIEITPTQVVWSDSGDLVSICTTDGYFILKYDADKVQEAMQDKSLIDEDGVEAAFDVMSENTDIVKTGKWVGDCFIYTNTLNRLNYYVGGEIVTIAHLDRTMYLLGYIANNNRIYLGDKELNVISYELQISVLEYQTAVMRKDFDTADRVLPSIPKEQRTRVAHFLEKQGFKPQALAVTTDPEHKFELALSLGQLDDCYKLVGENPSETKWKQLADLASKRANFNLAHQCYRQAGDLAGQLLLATSTGDLDNVKQLADDAQKKGSTNVSFLASFISSEHQQCLDLLISCNRLPEAAFFARTYFPSKVSEIMELWKKSLTVDHEQPKIADSLADPEKYDNLFEDYQDSLKAEEFFRSSHSMRPATSYNHDRLNESRNIFEEMESRQEPSNEEDDISSPPEMITSEDVKDATPEEHRTKVEDTKESDEDFKDADDGGENNESEDDDDDIDLEKEMENLDVDDADLEDMSDVEISD